MHDVSIIIVNYNGKKYLNNCIASIRQSDAADAEIIVVDNASTDGSCDEVEQSFPGVRIIRMNRNSGFAEANNVGAQAARGVYLLLLNNDTIVAPRWLAPLRTALATDRTIGVVGSKLLSLDNRNTIMSAGLNILFNGTGFDIGYLDEDIGQYDESGPRGAVCGAAMMVRKEEFLSLGGFDIRYFLYAEDLDLCWRYWLSGLTVMYIASSIVYHAFGGTSGSDRHTPLRVFYRVRNGFMNILKNYELLHIPFPMAFNVAFHAFQFALFVGTGRWKSAWAIFRAYGDCSRTLPYILKARKEVQSRRVMRDRILFERSLIVPLSTAVRELFRLRRAGRRAAAPSQRR